MLGKYMLLMIDINFPGDLVFGFFDWFLGCEKKVDVHVEVDGLRQEPG